MHSCLMNSMRAIISKTCLTFCILLTFLNHTSSSSLVNPMATLHVDPSITSFASTPYQTVEKRNVNNNGVRTSSHRLIFSQELRAHDWAQVLGNPCLAEPTPSAFVRENVLDVSGRERAVRAFASNTLGALRDVQSHLTPVECTDLSIESLPVLPNLTLSTRPPPTTPSTSTSGTTRQPSNATPYIFTLNILNKLYRTFHALSAHFHIMQTDWHEGRSCTRFPDRLIPKIERVKTLFHLGMCELMTPSDPHPLAAPYPSPQLLRDHQVALAQRLLHYRDCSGRMVRDCVLVNYARTLMQRILNESTPIS